MDPTNTKIKNISIQQHGAMDGIEPPCDLNAVRMYRLDRVRNELSRCNLAGIVLFDQLNTRYATDITNMQLWCLHNENRYVWVPVQGPVIIFEYDAQKHLSRNIPTVDEVRPALPFYYFAAGSRQCEKAKLWAKEIAELVKATGGKNNRIALDRAGPLAVFALQAENIEIVDGFSIMETAREIKSDGEIALMKKSIEACEIGIAAMHKALLPGITENELWAKLHESNIALGGEWIETRLLSSGPRTNPWFQESSMRKIKKGDLVSFDTDLIGPYGYCCDISRAWICDATKGTDEQRRLYSAAVEQIEHNKSIIKDGTTFREIAEKAWPIPEEFFDNRYGCILHGVGLCDEYPALPHLSDWERSGNDGTIKEGMTICIESFIGAKDGHEGVKLEEQLLVTAEGFEQLSKYPFENSLL